VNYRVFFDIGTTESLTLHTFLLFYKNEDAWTRFPVQQGKKAQYGKHSLIRLMPEAKCNFRVANKKIYRKPTLKFFMRRLPVDRKKKKVRWKNVFSYTRP